MKSCENKKYRFPKSEDDYAGLWQNRNSSHIDAKYVRGDRCHPNANDQLLWKGFLRGVIIVSKLTHFFPLESELSSFTGWTGSVCVLALWTVCMQCVAKGLNLMLRHTQSIKGTCWSPPLCGNRSLSPECARGTIEQDNDAASETRCRDVIISGIRSKRPFLSRVCLIICNCRGWGKLILKSEGIYLNWSSFPDSNEYHQCYNMTNDDDDRGSIFWK